MAEKRSIPTALGIVIGPTTAYISFLIFQSKLNEFLQFFCFVVFFIAAYDLAKSRLSLTGILTILLIPSLPFVLTLSQSIMATGNHLGAKLLILLWVASALLGAISGGMQAGQDNAISITRLAILASVLLLGLVGLYFV